MGALSYDFHAQSQSPGVMSVVQFVLLHSSFPDLKMDKAVLFGVSAAMPSQGLKLWLLRGLVHVQTALGMKPASVDAFGHWLYAKASTVARVVGLYVVLSVYLVIML